MKRVKEVQEKVRNVATKGIDQVQKVEKVKIVDEFKNFIARGNVLDLAVGVIIGGAFQSIIKSLVNDIIMPLISALFGRVDFSEWVLKIGKSTIPYGSFISAVVNFLLIAFSLFLVVKYINRLNRKIEEAKKQEAEQIEKLRKKNKCRGRSCACP